MNEKLKFKLSDLSEIDLRKLLKCCPFCGRDKPMKRETNGLIYIQCLGCKVKGPKSYDLDYCIDHWNERVG